jgi:hypothetical protein
VQLAEAWVADIFEMIEEYKAYDEIYTFSDFLSRGEDQYFYTCMLTPETAYTVVAFSVDAEGNIGESLSLKEFSTGKVKPSNNTFTITVEEGVAKIDAKNKQEYYLFEIYEAAELASLSEQQIISRLIYDAIDYGIDEFVMGCGFDELDYSTTLINGTRYVACCVGYDGGATTQLTRYDFTYATAGGDDYESDLMPGVSNLSSNVTFRPTELYVEDSGDYYSTGTKSIYVEAYNAESGQLLYLEVFVPLTATDFAGTYHTSSKIGDVHTMMRGYEDSEAYLFGSWFCDEATTEYSAAYDGKSTLAFNGSTITIDVEWRDENSKSVKMTYSGAFELGEGSYYNLVSTAAQRCRHRVHHRTVKQQKAATASTAKRVRRGDKFSKKVSLK